MRTKMHRHRAQLVQLGRGHLVIRQTALFALQEITVPLEFVKIAQQPRQIFRRLDDFRAGTLDLHFACLHQIEDPLARNQVGLERLY